MCMREKGLHWTKTQKDANVYAQRDLRPPARSTHASIYTRNKTLGTHGLHEHARVCTANARVSSSSEHVQTQARRPRRHSEHTHALALGKHKQAATTTNTSPTLKHACKCKCNCKCRLSVALARMQTNKVAQRAFWLSSCQSPYELRWKSRVPKLAAVETQTCLSATCDALPHISEAMCSPVTTGILLGRTAPSPKKTGKQKEKKKQREACFKLVPVYECRTKPMPDSKTAAPRNSAPTTPNNTQQVPSSPFKSLQVPASPCKSLQVPASCDNSTLELPLAIADSAAQPSSCAMFPNGALHLHYPARVSSPLAAARKFERYKRRSPENPWPQSREAIKWPRRAVPSACPRGISSLRTTSPKTKVPPICQKTGKDETWAKMLPQRIGGIALQPSNPAWCAAQTAPTETSGMHSMHQLVGVFQEFIHPWCRILGC